MSAGPRADAPPAARRRWPVALALLCAGVLVLLALLWWIVPVERAIPLVLARLGASLGLEISAEGDSATRLGRHPSFVVRDLVAREPGAAQPLLRAKRVLVSLPWRTIRGGGGPLELGRIELDAPELDVAALQRWLASRPPRDGRLPTLSDGLHVRDGVVRGDGWSVEALALVMPRLHPEAPLRARASGRYVDASLLAPFQLAATLQRPASGRGFALVGTVAPASGDWRLPLWLNLSGALHWQPALALLPARLGASGRFVSGEIDAPFSLGLHGLLRAHSDAWTLVPAGLALRGDGLVPKLDARGRLALGRGLLLELQGRMARWPSAWPALPQPLDGSRPMGLALRYRGRPDLSAPLSLQLASDGARFDGALDIPGLLAWTADPGRGSPLPPLRGQLQAQALEIAGARLEGVSITIEDEATPEP